MMALELVDHCGTLGLITIAIPQTAGRDHRRGGTGEGFLREVPQVTAMKVMPSE